MTRKELLEIPHRGDLEILHNVSGVYVIPSGRKHDSGWAMMDFVATFEDGRKARFGGGCDDVAFYGGHFRMDCTHPERILHIWNPYLFSISEDLSSINFVEVDSLR